MGFVLSTSSAASSQLSKANYSDIIVDVCAILIFITSLSGMKEVNRRDAKVAVRKITFGNE